MNDETINEMIIKCPACGIEGVAKSIMKELEIPHFGQVMETTLQCPACGFKHSDILALEHKDPGEDTLTHKQLFHGHQTDKQR